MIDFRSVSLGTGGTAACRLCGGVPATSCRDLPEIADDIGRLARGWTGAPGPNVLLCGCEPFRHSALPEIVRLAVDSGVERIGLLTDATMLGREGNAQGAIAEGVRYVETVLLGGCAEQHDRLSGVSGSFEAALAGMRAFVEAARDAGQRVSLIGRVTVCPHTLKALPEITLAFAQAGAIAVRYVVDEALSPAKLEWLCAALDTATVSRMWGWVDGLDAAALGDRALHANAPVTVVEVACE